MITLQEEVLNKIKFNRGLKRESLRGLVGSHYQMNFQQLRMILADLIAQGEVVEIKYKFMGEWEYFYLPMVDDFRITGKGIQG